MRTDQTEQAIKVMHGFSTFILLCKRRAKELKMQTMRTDQTKPAVNSLYHTNSDRHRYGLRNKSPYSLRDHTQPQNCGTYTNRPLEQVQIKNYSRILQTALALRRNSCRGNLNECCECKIRRTVLRPPSQKSLHIYLY
jgi:hypothetical protein